VLEEGRSRLTSADDVLTDVFVPRRILGDRAKAETFARRLMRDVFQIATVRDSFRKHFRRHGYRDIAVFGHPCETVDDWIVPKPRPECSVASGGSGGGGGGGRDFRICLY
jgi:hypothetical protein